MSVDNSLGPEGISHLAEARPPVRPRVVEPPATPDLGEPGSWFLLLVPITICLGLLIFSAFSSTF